MPTLRRDVASVGLNGAADVLVIGGGPSAAWAAVAAAEAGARVTLVDKGYHGTSGATAPSNTGTWCVAPGDHRAQAVARRWERTIGIADQRWMLRLVDRCYENLQRLVEWGYPFPSEESGLLYTAELCPDQQDELNQVRHRTTRLLVSSARSSSLVSATSVVVSTWQLVSSSCSLTPRAAAWRATASLRATGSPVPGSTSRNSSSTPTVGLLAIGPQNIDPTRRRPHDGPDRALAPLGVALGRAAKSGG